MFFTQQFPVCSPDGSTSELRAVRYAESITVHVELQSDQSDGHIYPPHIAVTYAVATEDDYLAYKNVSVSGSVRLRAPQDRQIHHRQIIWPQPRPHSFWPRPWSWPHVQLASLTSLENGCHGSRDIGVRSDLGVFVLWSGKFLDSHILRSYFFLVFRDSFSAQTVTSHAHVNRIY